MSTRILVIEDNAANLELARYLLEAAGYDVLTAEDGEEGLRHARQARPDLVVSDLQMPVMDGFEFLAELRADPELKHLPVIAVTAFSMPGDATRVMQAGFDGYLSKPIVPETFVEQVAAYLPRASRE